jgi:hypothetical protein
LTTRQRWRHSFRRVRLAGVVALSFISAASARRADAQAPASDPRVHPELVDSTWGRRTLAVWQIAWAGHWAAAEQGFAALQREQPNAIEPLLGRGFVARGTGHFEEARGWYRAALAHDSSLTAAKTELAALEWEEPSSLEVTTGAAAIASVGAVPGVTAVEADVNLAAVINPSLTVLARLGALESGDPSEGVVLSADSSLSARTSVVGAGVVVHPTSALWLTPRMEEWFTAGTRETFAWLDGAVRIAPWVTLLAGVRPISGSTGATQFSGGADFVVADRQTLTLVAARGVTASPLEAREQVRAFWQRAPASPFGFRLGLIRDIDPLLSATTAIASGTAMVTPTRGFRLELSTRSGAYARQSVTAGVIARW